MPLKLILSLFSSFITLSAACQQGKQQVNRKPGNDSIPPKVYAVVEEPPLFPGGEEGLARYLAKNIRYTAKVQEEGIYSSVSVQFVVDTLGCLRDIKPMKGSRSGALEEELTRVVKMMPAWKPGMHQGKKVAVLFYLPVKCILPQE